MGANKEKQNLRYKKVSQRLDKKVRYDGFSVDEVKIIKAHKNFEHFDKELNKFWAYAPRNKDNNSVDWDKLTEAEMNSFEYINKEKDKYLQQIIRFEKKGFDLEKIMRTFMQINIQSVCY